MQDYLQKSHAFKDGHVNKFSSIEYESIVLFTSNPGLLDFPGNWFCVLVQYFQTDTVRTRAMFKFIC